jgi:hypothetical protein
MLVNRMNGMACGRAPSTARRQATLLLSGVLLAALSLLGTATKASGAAPATLNVSVLGPGAVTSTPTGIACPPKCTGTFATGTKVVLTAKAHGGSTFSRWSGSCTGGGGVCSVKVSGLTAVAAQFTAQTKPNTNPTTGNKSPAVPGSYSGSWNPANGGDVITYFVAPGGRSILNIHVPYASVSCVPASAMGGYAPIIILKTPINPDGSFTATGSQQGIFDNSSAKFSFSLAGRFRGTTRAGPASASGTFREGVQFTASGATESCTSNTQSWSVTHDPQSTPTNTTAVPGSYSGSWNPANGGDVITYFVAPGGRSLLNVHVPYASVTCVPASASGGYAPIIVPMVPVNGDGSFSVTASQKGIFDNSSATFSYSFSGFVEGATPTGPVTMAGNFRMNVQFATSGATESCTSDTQSWSVTHDPQPSPTDTSAVAGSYSGSWNPANGGDVITFSVAPGGRSLLNVHVPYASASCVPPSANGGYVPISIAAVPVNADGSFASTSTQEGIFDKANAKFTISFAGHLEGATPTGPVTMAGNFRVDALFSASGVTESCTTNTQSWTASRT